MKKLIFILLISVSAFAQKQVFNVQKYCIDEKPTLKGQCDISGNEYSFVFVDNKKKEVVFFLTEIKFVYSIVSVGQTATHSVYKIKNESGDAEMKINKLGNKIEFLYPDRYISLVTGKSTKSQ